MTYSSRPGSSTSATALVHLVHARVDEGGALVVDQELVELKVRPLVQADGRGDPVDAVDDLVYAGHASRPFAIECIRVQRCTVVGANTTVSAVAERAAWSSLRVAWRGVGLAAHDVKRDVGVVAHHPAVVARGDVEEVAGLHHV